MIRSVTLFGYNAEIRLGGEKSIAYKSANYTLEFQWETIAAAHR